MTVWPVRPQSCLSGAQVSKPAVSPISNRQGLANPEALEEKGFRAFGNPRYGATRWSRNQCGAGILACRLGRHLAARPNSKLWKTRQGCPVNRQAGSLPHIGESSRAATIFTDTNKLGSLRYAFANFLPEKTEALRLAEARRGKSDLTIWNDENNCVSSRIPRGVRRAGC